MHPPPFRLMHLLSDWPDCNLELHCCRGQVVYPVRLLLTSYAGLTFTQILARLRCKHCGGKPAPVYLCAGHREHNHGAPPDWAVELVPQART
jgi:hypothetical protein